MRRDTASATAKGELAISFDTSNDGRKDPMVQTIVHSLKLLR
jgi:hypothetical protein